MRACVSALLLALLGSTGLARAQELVPPTQLEAAPAPYPDGAHGEGVVVLELEIGKDGTVTQATVKSGEEPFASLARKTVLDWRFTPATRGGLPIRSRIEAKLHFSPAPPPALAPAPDSSLPSPTLPPIEIKVLGEEREELGSTHLPKSETRLVPGAFADPFRVVEVMPGVAPVLSGLPYFFVRGAPPGDVGYFIDGIRVPILFHVGPGPSVIAPSLIERVDLFPAAYPARQGRYVGGVMAGETSGASAVERGEIQARVFDASGFVESPFADGRGAIAFGGRVAYMGAILAAFAPDYGLSYGDYQARVGYALGEHDRVSLFAFGGFDRLVSNVVQRTLFDVAFHRLDLRWEHTTEGGRVRVAATLGADRTLSTEEDASVAGAFSTSESARLRLELEQRLGKGLKLRAGGDVGAERFSADREARGEGAISFPARTDVFGGVYLDLVARASSAVELVPGLRVDAIRTRDEDFFFFEPRFASRVKVARGVAWISAFGVAHQVPTAIVRVPGLYPSALEVSPQEAFQASQGVEVALPEKLSVKLTGFRARVLSPRSGASAESHGLELFLRRDFTAKLGGFVSYTLSRSTRDALVSSFDRTHVLSWVLGYDLGRGFRVGGRLYVASGRPYRVWCPSEGCGPGDPTAPRTHVVEGRLPTFSRLDVRAEKRWTSATGSWIAATFEWFNALLSQEAEDASWNPDRGEVDLYRRSPLTIPSLGVEAGF